MTNLSIPEHSGQPRVPSVRRRQIKCVIWDLDNTIWRGTLLEGDPVRVREDVVEIIKTLDGRGILQSIASRNAPLPALDKLKQFNLDQYFLFPQIHWGSKADSIRTIAAALNIGIESTCLIDDEMFELEEVRSILPDTLCINQADLGQVLEMPELNPLATTAESAARRETYQRDLQRAEVEESFTGSHADFLASLGMVLTVFPAKPEDLARAEELTDRTNQLNTTGYTFSVAELEEFRVSSHHLLLMAELVDRFGSYGRIGLGLIERDSQIWTIKLLLMSCRVMNRGVGMVLLCHILQQAKCAGVRLLSEFIPNDRNRIMHVTYKFAGFRECQANQCQPNDRLKTLEHDLGFIPPIPDYITLKTEPYSF
jgi:FkbH-like protein